MVQGVNFRVEDYALAIVVDQRLFSHRFLPLLTKVDSHLDLLSEVGSFDYFAENSILSIHIQGE
jgi:hypothetical protein